MQYAHTFLFETDIRFKAIVGDDNGYSIKEDIKFTIVNDTLYPPNQHSVCNKVDSSIRGNTINNQTLQIMLPDGTILIWPWEMIRQAKFKYVTHIGSERIPDTSSNESD